MTPADRMTTAERLKVGVMILDEIDRQRDKRRNPFYAGTAERQTITPHLDELAGEWRESGYSLPGQKPRRRGWFR